MSCCLIDFNNLVSTSQGVASLRAEWVQVTNTPPAGTCRNSLMDMYRILSVKQNINNLINNKKMELEKYSYKVKAGSEILYIAGTRTDISEWTQEQIMDYLTKYPKAEGHFELTEIEIDKTIKEAVIITASELNEFVKKTKIKK